MKQTRGYKGVSLSTCEAYLLLKKKNPTLSIVLDYGEKCGWGVCKAEFSPSMHQILVLIPSSKDKPLSCILKYDLASCS